MLVTTDDDAPKSKRFLTREKTLHEVRNEAEAGRLVVGGDGVATASVVSNEEEDGKRKECGLIASVLVEFLYGQKR